MLYVYSLGFDCSLCPDKSFKTWQQLRRHKLGKHGQEVNCNYCQYKTSMNTKFLMRKHYQAKHPGCEFKTPPKQTNILYVSPSPRPPTPMRRSDRERTPDLSPLPSPIPITLDFPSPFRALFATPEKTQKEVGLNTPSPLKLQDWEDSISCWTETKAVETQSDADAPTSSETAEAIIQQARKEAACGSVIREERNLVSRTERVILPDGTIYVKTETFSAEGYQSTATQTEDTDRREEGVQTVEESVSHQEKGCQADFGKVDATTQCFINIAYTGSGMVMSAADPVV